MQQRIQVTILRYLLTIVKLGFFKRVTHQHLAYRNDSMKTHANVVETKSKFIDNLQEGAEVNV